MPPLQGVDWHILVAAAAGTGEFAAHSSYEDRQLPGGDGLPIAPPVSPDNVLVSIAGSSGRLPPDVFMPDFL